MSRDLDYGDFHRFLASLGVLLVTLAFAAPWVWLHDPAVFSQPPIDLFGSPTELQGGAALRARYIYFVAVALPWVCLVLFLTGLALITWASCKWYYKQKQRDAKERHEINTVLQGTEQGTEAAKNAEVQAASRRDEAEPAEPTSSDSLVVTYEKAKTQVRSEYEAVENELIDRIAAASADTHEALRNRRIGTAEFDLLLIPRNDSTKPHVIVEIKVVFRSFKLNWLLESLRRLQVSGELYRERFQRASKNVLLIVAPRNQLVRKEFDSYIDEVMPLINQDKTSVCLVSIENLSLLTGAQLLTLINTQAAVVVLPTLTSDNR